MVHKPALWVVNYPGAIQVEAANYGYTMSNNPKAWCLHTPEEPADATPSTPYFFHNTGANASTHYFVSALGFVFQMVPENEGAYGNVRDIGNKFHWETVANLNLQTLSVEIEGFAHNITKTMPRGGPQWRALIGLLSHRCKGLGILISRTFGHKEVSSTRRDPGDLNIQHIKDDVNKVLNEMEEGDEDMAQVLVRPKGRGEVYILVDGCRLQHTWGTSVTSPDQNRNTITEYPIDHWVWELPVSYYQVPRSLLEE